MKGVARLKTLSKRNRRKKQETYLTEDEVYFKVSKCYK